VDGPITPDIYIEGKNTFLCNNIFFTGGSAVIGQGTDIITTAGGIFQMSNNLFQGNVNSTFSAYDQAPVFGNPLFEDPGEGLARGFILQDGSPALQSAKLFDEPEFHMAGKGIFKDIPSVPKEDMFGNPVNLQHTSNIGAYNGIPWATGFTDRQILRDEISIVPNPATDHLVVVFKSELTRLARIGLTDLSGRVLYNTGRLALAGENRMRIQLPETLSPGIYMLYIQKDGYQSGKSFLVKEKE
jgi:hypothetical protein